MAKWEFDLNRVEVSEYDQMVADLTSGKAASTAKWYARMLVSWPYGKETPTEEGILKLGLLQYREMARQFEATFRKVLLETEAKEPDQDSDKAGV